jgi:3-hydroxyisobutyrate dehydrogenase-like beta-hydroxyacid dehydrogenase
MAVYDIRHGAMAPFEDSGAYLASDVPDLVRHSDVVAFCVLDNVQVRDLVLGAGGLIGNLQRGQLVLMPSTVAPCTGSRAFREPRGTHRASDSLMRP